MHHLLEIEAVGVFLDEEDGENSVQYTPENLTVSQEIKSHLMKDQGLDAVIDG